MSSPAVVAASTAAAVVGDAPAAAVSESESPVVDADLALIRSLVRSHADFPSPGINFRDIFPVFQSPRATRLLLTRLTSLIQSSYSPLPDVIVGLDSRGFLFGPSMALGLDAAFVPVRKAGKLPGACHQVTYTTEYSKATTEIQVGAIQPGQRVVIVDDLLATGGTLASALQLVRQLGGVVIACVVVIELDECAGRKMLVEKHNIRSENIHSLLKY